MDRITFTQDKQGYSVTIADKEGVDTIPVNKWEYDALICYWVANFREKAMALLEKMRQENMY